MASPFQSRRPRLRIPSFPGKCIRGHNIRELGSAHVSVELERNGDVITIEAECTDPPWQERPMAYLGLQSSGKFLYTMLYQDVPVGPVKFRIWAGDELLQDHEFYERVEDDDGNIFHIVDSWVFPGSVSTTPGLEDMVTPPESLRSPLFGYESTTIESPETPTSASDHECQPWRRHRRTHSVSFHTPPTSPLDMSVNSFMLPATDKDLIGLPPTPVSPIEPAVGNSDVQVPHTPTSSASLERPQSSLETIDETDEELQETVEKMRDALRHPRVKEDERKRKWSKRNSENE